jgi:hypothetical protein
VGAFAQARVALKARRRISRQLNKGESLHALKRDLLYAHEGTLRTRHLEQQTEHVWCLPLVTNAVVTWTTEYYGLAVESMRRAGRRIDDEVLAHISPAHSEKSTSSAPSTWTSRASSPSSAPPGTGRCACATTTAPGPLFEPVSPYPAPSPGNSV